MAMASQLRETFAKRFSAHPDNEYVDVDAAACILGVSKSFLNKARVTGSGPPFVKFGAAVRYRVETLRGWAAARTRCSTSDEGAA
jgi:hypothetical protein